MLQSLSPYTLATDMITTRKKPRASTVSKRLPPLTLPMTGGALKLTVEQWQQYISPNLEDQRGELETVGMWNVPIRYMAPAVSAKFNSLGWVETYTLYGPRTLSGCYESGHQLEGIVTVKGRKARGFTSSLLCELPDGTLLETATIHVCSQKAA